MKKLEWQRVQVGEEGRSEREEEGELSSREKEDDEASVLSRLG